MNNTTPIGVFDSGIGGLSVLREIRRLLPSADLVYLADQAFAPYGDRSLGDVRTRVSSIVAALIEQGCGPIVMACNTASAAALHHVRRLHGDVVFVGMEPAVKPAAETTGAGVIGDYTGCSFRIDGVGTFVAGATADPALKRELGIEEGRRVVVMLARLHSQKRHTRLLG